MEILVLADKTELEIKSGAAIGSITVAVEDFVDLGTVATALTKAGNLEQVEFKTDSTLTGKYTHMKLENPLFTAVDMVGEKVEATFGIREKTELEKEIDEIKAQQTVQDGAILDLAGVIGGQA